MNNTTLGSKLIVIGGPTASGKTALAIDLAEKFDGEIVCADSRTIYKGMDIGTAKPSRENQARVRHHLLDIVEPGESLSAAEFKRLAEATIADIRARGKLPFLVGGSGLYIDAVVFDYQFPGKADSAMRVELEAMTDDELRDKLALVDPEAQVDLANRRRVLRAIETAGQMRSRLSEPRPEVLLLGLTLNKEVAQQRIQNRVKKMLEEGFLEEVKNIGAKFGWETPAMSVIGYGAFRDVARGLKIADEGAEDFVKGDLALYKKQVTWFKRNRWIQWVERADEAEAMVRAFVARV